MNIEKILTEEEKEVLQEKIVCKSCYGDKFKTNGRCAYCNTRPEK
jgi:hypothetical protein